MFGWVAWASALPLPTTDEDFILPGSQPDTTRYMESHNVCINCHGGHDINIEQSFAWMGTMMGNAARDPLFHACMAIANQDAPQSGDLCIRCHAPNGWLSGRSTPPDGSALNAEVSSDGKTVACRCKSVSR
jgi:mono/diheme cytochrome c family protein